MEGQQTQQEDTLMKVEVDSFEVNHRLRRSPADRRGSSKRAVAVAAVMGLVIVALLGIILYFVMFTASIKQDVPTVTTITPKVDITRKVDITHKITNCEEQQRHVIFTVDKAATYLIYGWVQFSHATGEGIVLMQTLQGRNVTIQKKIIDRPQIFLFDQVILANGITISIDFNSVCTDGLFHLHEL